jgi:hypothetical protein
MREIQIRFMGIGGNGDKNRSIANGMDTWDELVCEWLDNTKNKIKKKIDFFAIIL